MACIKHEECNGVVKNGHEDHWCGNCGNGDWTGGSCKGIVGMEHLCTKDCNWIPKGKSENNAGKKE